MDNSTHNQETLDFLIYSYFGIVPKEIFDERNDDNNPKFAAIENDCYRDYCIRMAIMKAYDDATGEGAYNTLFQAKKCGVEKIEKLKNGSAYAKRNAANLIFCCVKRIKEYSDYDSWHESLCNSLVHEYSEVCSESESFFTYGNAQKWVNMTMKYLWLLKMLPDGVDQNNLHIPIDSYIIDALWNTHKDIPLPIKDKAKREKTYVQPSSYVTSWSTWGEPDENDGNKPGPYKLLHTSLVDKKIDIAWENKTWIRQAEIRKKSNKKNKLFDFFGKG